MSGLKFAPIEQREFDLDIKECMDVSVDITSMTAEDLVAHLHPRDEPDRGFPRGTVFRYERGDVPTQQAAQEHGRTLGIPEAQLDWRHDIDPI